MKKIKLMLLAITVVAATGGVFAFKTLKTDKFCTAATDSSGSCPAKCPGGLEAQAGNGQTICTVGTSNTANCANANLDCAGTIRTTNE